jgi:hypothetical protein
MRTQRKNGPRPDPNRNETELRVRPTSTSRATNPRTDSIWRKIFAQLKEDGLGLTVSLRRWIERQDRRFDVPKPTDRSAR